MYRCLPRLRSLSLLLACLLVSAPPLTVRAYDWPSFRGTSQYQGDNTDETTLTAANVAGLHRLFHVGLPAIADGVPVFLQAVSTLTGTRDLLFLTTRAGDILALDAHDGTTLWQHTNGPGDCRINNGPAPCYTTSSPAIDPDRHFVYSYGLDGFVHKYAVGDGTEVMDSGWPALVTRKGYDEKGSSALAVATAHDGTSYLYVAHAGYPGDQGDYQGHLTTINLATGAQHVFNTDCSDQVDVHFFPQGQGQDCASVQTAVWVRQAVVYDPDTDRIYTTTGNGEYDGMHNWGESVLALHPDGTGANEGPLDSYTPSDEEALSARDADLGSTAPVILPPLPGSTVAHLAVQGGKDAKLRLLNLDDLSEQGGPGHTGGEVGEVVDVPQGGAVLTAPAVWTDPMDGSVWVIVTNALGVSALRVVAGEDGTPSLVPQWQNAAGGTTPMVANGMVFYAGSGTIRAVDVATGQELWQDGIGSIHWESPVVANGMVYITNGDGMLTAYGL
jgi:outer membrane protein assembly factor BamB